MNQELIFTSAKRGLGVGKSGFCTVATTQGMATPAVRLLESLSGYRHLHPPGSADAKQNPVVYSHLATRVAGYPSSILSRISDAGLDYSNRSNKLAHHIVLGSPTAVAGGPTAILGNHGFFETEWSGEPRILPNRQFSGQAVPTVACNTWKQLTGHAGWAGELVDALRKKETAYIVVQPTTPAFQLISEALALLPVAERWQVSFSSFFTNLPPGIECQWRCVMAGSPEAAAARRSPRNRVIDLANLAGAPSNPYLQNAIDGQTVESVSGSRTALKLELVPQKPKPVPQPPPAPNDPAEGPPELSSPPSLDGAQAAETNDGIRPTLPGSKPGQAPSLSERPTPAPQTDFDDFDQGESNGWKMLAICLAALILIMVVGVAYVAMNDPSPSSVVVEKDSSKDEKPKPKPEPEPEPKPKPEPEPEPKPEPKPEPEPKQKPKQKPEPTTEPPTEPEPAKVKTGPLLEKAYASIRLPSSPASRQRRSRNQTWSIFGKPIKDDPVEVFQLDWTGDQPVQWTVRLLTSNQAASPIPKDPDDPWNRRWQINQENDNLGTLEIKFNEDKYIASFELESRKTDILKGKVVQIGLGVKGAPDLEKFNLPLSSLKVAPQVKSKTEFKFGLPMQVQYQKEEGSSSVKKKNAKLDIELTKKVTESLDELVSKTKGYGLWKFKPSLDNDNGIEKLKFDIVWQDDGKVKQELKDLFKELHCELITEADGTCKFKAEFYPLADKILQARNKVDDWVKQSGPTELRNNKQYRNWIIAQNNDAIVRDFEARKAAHIHQYTHRGGAASGMKQWPSVAKSVKEDLEKHCFKTYCDKPRWQSAFIYGTPVFGKTGLTTENLGTFSLNKLLDDIQSETNALSRGLKYCQPIVKKHYEAYVRQQKDNKKPIDPSKKSDHDDFVKQGQFWNQLNGMLSGNQKRGIQLKLNEQFFVIPLLVDGHPMDQNRMVQDYHLIVAGNFPKDNNGREIKPEQIFQQTFDDNNRWFLEHVVQPRGNTAVNSGRQSGNNNRNQNGRTGSQQGRPQSGVRLQGNDDPDNDQQKKDEDSD